LAHVPLVTNNCLLTTDEIIAKNLFHV
jgi:hypothetical protein